MANHYKRSEPASSRTGHHPAGVRPAFARCHHAVITARYDRILNVFSSTHGFGQPSPAGHFFARAILPCSRSVIVPSHSAVTLAN